MASLALRWEISLRLQEGLGMLVPAYCFLQIPAGTRPGLVGMGQRQAWCPPQPFLTGPAPRAHSCPSCHLWGGEEPAAVLPRALFSETAEVCSSRRPRRVMWNSGLITGRGPSSVVRAG